MNTVSKNSNVYFKATVDKGWIEYMSFAEAVIFKYAFKLGSQIVIQTICDKIEFKMNI